MKFARIEFNSESDAAAALYGLMQRGKITVLRDHSFIVPAPALDWLNAEKIPFKLRETLNHDNVLQTLRDHLAHAV
jgi:hypothetical protein